MSVGKEVREVVKWINLQIARTGRIPLLQEIIAYERQLARQR